MNTQTHVLNGLQVAEAKLADAEKWNKNRGNCSWAAIVANFQRELGAARTQAKGFALKEIAISSGVGWVYLIRQSADLQMEKFRAPAVFGDPIGFDVELPRFKIRDNELHVYELQVLGNSEPKLLGVIIQGEEKEGTTRHPIPVFESLKGYRPILGDLPCVASKSVKLQDLLLEESDREDRLRVSSLVSMRSREIWKFQRMVFSRE